MLAHYFAECSEYANDQSTYFHVTNACDKLRVECAMIIQMEHLPAPEALRIAYLQTVLIVDGRPADDVVAEMGSFWVLTAYNPLSEQLSAVENVERQQKLVTRLGEMSYQWLPALGASPEGTWDEESLAVFGAGKRPIRALGREFNQHGVFEVTKQALKVHGCFSRWSMQRPLRRREGLLWEKASNC